MRVMDLFFIFNPILPYYNIDNDHLDFYESNQEKLNQSFVSFAENLPFYGFILLNLDDPNIRKISKDYEGK